MRFIYSFFLCIIFINKNVILFLFCLLLKDFVEKLRILMFYGILVFIYYVINMYVY